MDTTRTTLMNLGLTQTEVKVYLALLSLGTAPASALSRRTRIGRSTTQYACKQLAKKGLVSQSQKGHTFYYTMLPTERLEVLLNHQLQEAEAKYTALEEHKKDLALILSTLNSMRQTASVVPRVQFYEGKESLKQLIMKLIEKREPLYSIEDKGDMISYLPQFTRKIVNARVKHGIPNKVICPKGHPINKTSKEELREVRYIDIEKYPFSGQIDMCKDTVMIFSYEEETAMAIEIQHTDIANNFHLLFQLLWDSLGKK